MATSGAGNASKSAHFHFSAKVVSGVAAIGARVSLPGTAMPSARRPRPRPTLLASLLVCAVALLAPTLADAYLLNSRAVFRRFAERQALDHAKPGTLVGRALVQEPVPNGREKDVPVKVDVAFPAACTARLELPDGVSQVSVAKGKLSSEGAEFPALQAYAALGCPLATLKNMPASDAEVTLVRVAGTLGVDQATVTLSRLGRRAAWVVGAKPQELQKPQLWFDKETSRPIRVIAKWGGQTWDIRFDDPAAIATGGRHPRVVEVWLGAQRQLAMRLMAGELGAARAADSELEDEGEGG